MFLRIQPHIGLLDVPNERSSHSKPVPRGGGIAVVAVIIGVFISTSLLTSLKLEPIFIVAGLIIATVSLVDDIRPIPFLPRLVVHFAAAGMVVWHFGGYLDIRVPILGESGKFLQSIATVIFIVWMTNAYNFMDGIDGILGVQGLVAGGAWALLGIMTGSPVPVLLGTSIAGSCVGFLFFNWHPAKVFMGDVGSTFLGFTFACIPLVSTVGKGTADTYGFALSVCFSLLFLFDTIYTRIRLIATGRLPWLPHREHFYQRLVLRGLKHSTVSLYFALAGSVVAFTGIMAFVAYVTAAIAIVVGAAGSMLLLFWTGKKNIDLNIG